MEEEKKGFSKEDRPVLSSTGGEGENAETGSDTTTSRESGSAAEKSPGGDAQEAAKERYRAATEAAGAKLPAINFATFIFSLDSSALVHLGIIDDPASGEKARNLPLAKQTIDLLGMLQKKTRGNLTADEDAMLKDILYDLRILYVKEKE